MLEMTSDDSNPGKGTSVLGANGAVAAEAMTADEHGTLNPSTEGAGSAEAATTANAVSAEPEFKKKKYGLVFWLAIGWLVWLVGSTILARLGLLPFLKDPNQTFSGVARTGPSAEHWFGADNIGKDVFARTIYGAFRSLSVAIFATAAGLSLGGAIGLISGYFKGGIDQVLSSVINIILSVPAIVLALALVTFLAPPGSSSTSKTIWAAVALSILSVPSISRVARAQTMVWADREFVLASRTLGARPMRIMVREILPNVLPSMFAFAFIGVAVLIVVEASLAFLGVGDVQGVSWGIMIQSGRDRLADAPHMVLFPSLFMFITILALNYLGDKVRELTDIRESGL